VCACAKTNPTKELNGGEYDIGWDCDVYSLKFVFYIILNA